MSERIGLAADPRNSTGSTAARTLPVEPVDEPELWRALRDFRFDEPGAELPFSRRLARDSCWPHSFALRVVEEYRRFLYLTRAAGHPCTPSEEVDQAWHLHLVYTRSYWDELCGRVLGRPLHHDPTRGGHDEGVKFEAWYERTKQSYARVFGAPPPADVWPSSAVRFGRDTRWVRVNRDDWELSPRLGPGALVRRLGAWRARVPWLALFALLLLPGCEPARLGETVGWPFNLAGGDFLLLVVVLICLLLLAQIKLFALFERASSPDAADLTADPAQYELVAHLGGGPRRAVAAVVHRLIAGGSVEHRRERFHGWEVHATERAQPAGASALELAVWSATDGGIGLREIQSDRRVRTALDELRRRSIALGWIRPAPHLLGARMSAALVWCALVALIGLRIAQGRANEQPVGFLWFLAAIALVIGVVTWLRAFRSSVPPAIQEQLLALERTTTAEPIASLGAGPPGHGALQQSALYVAVLGADALEPNDPLVGSLLKRKDAGGGASGGCGEMGGASSGCGDGGGGGGCGGCGS